MHLSHGFLKDLQSLFGMIFGFFVVRTSKIDSGKIGHAYRSVRMLLAQD